MFLGEKAKNLKNNKTTLKINHTFSYCLKMKNFIAGPCHLVYFVGLRLGFDVPKQIFPVRRWSEGQPEGSEGHSEGSEGKQKLHFHGCIFVRTNLF